MHRIGLVSLPSGLGDPTPTGSGVCDNTTLRSSGARGLDVSRCYRHIAPLERKAPTHQNSRCVMHRIGLVSSSSGLGDPTPTGSGVCDNTALRSSGARGLDVSRCYRHIAPLERKAGQFAVHHPSYWLGFLAQRVGDPIPTDRVRQYHIALLWSAGIGRVALLWTYRSSGAKGTNTPKFKVRDSSYWLGFLVQRVGGPNAYGFRGVRQYHIALLWSAGVGCVALL